MSTPMSQIWICSGVRLTPSYEHTFFFDSVASQQAYFSGRVVKTLSNYTFLRKEWSLKVEATMGETKGWNYLYFRNTRETNNKVYYYFINKIEYVNEHTVELFLEMDVMQTFYFDYGVLSSYVERCHSSTDEAGDNIVDEGLDLGQYFNMSTYEETTLDEICILILTTLDINTFTVDSDGKVSVSENLGTTIDGVFSSAGLYAVEVGRWSSIKSILNYLNEKGKTGAIISMWMFPKCLVQLATGEDWNTNTGYAKTVYGIKKDFSSVELLEPVNLAGSYVPRNKKLFTHPFSFLYVTNNLGGSAMYKFEKFYSWNNDHTRRSVSFKYGGTVLPEGGVRIYPKMYDNMTENYEEGLSLSSFPTCVWNEDVYKMWLAQNQHSRDVAMTGGIIKTGVGLMTAIGAGATGNAMAGAGGVATAYSGAMEISSLIAERKDKEVQPPQAKGNLSGSINTAMNKNHFTFMYKTVDPETAKRIDDYFSMYGYKQNQVMDANFKDRMPRQYWAYIKTVDVKAYGNIPSNYMETIRNVYNKGVTFWKEPDNLGKYHNHGYMGNPIV